MDNYIMGRNSQNHEREMDNCNAKMADVARTGVPDISCTYWLY
jgi:hypothetical protein